MKYRTDYWKEIDKIKLPQKIDDDYVKKILKNNLNDSYNLEKIYGICGKDVTNIDMSNLSYESFLKLSFDSNTIFSKEQINRFKPDNILKKSSEYYEGIEDLHKAGINGDGVKIVIMDDPFDHTIGEFKDVEYHDEKIEEKNVSYLHGTTVTSIIKKISPNSDISFYASKYDDNNKDKFYSDRKDVLNKIGEGNIKADIVSSSSVMIENGKEESKKYVDMLKKQGCEYIDSKRFSKDFTHANKYEGRICLANNEYNITDDEYNEFVKKAKYDIKNLEIIASQSKGDKKKEYLDKLNIYKNSLVSKEAYKKEIEKFKNNRSNDKILVLSGGINYTQNDCNGGIMYCGSSSQSWAIPQVSAIYSLAKQMDRNISYEEFCEVCEGIEINSKYKVINPEQIVRKINERNKEKAELNDDYKEIYEKSSVLINNLDRVKEQNIKII